MKIKFTAILLLVLIVTAKYNSASAQNEQSKWAVGLGMNAVDDNGSGLPSFSSLMLVPLPSKVHAARYLGHGVSLDASVCYNKFPTGKKLIGEPDTLTTSNNLLLSFDLSLKYDLYKFYYVVNDLVRGIKREDDAISRTAFFTYFDPYLLWGYGYTQRPYREKTPNTPTNNFGAGFNVWIKSFIGLNFQSVAKFRLKEGASNYIQYSFGVIYRFPKAPAAGNESKKVNMAF